MSSKRYRSFGVVAGVLPVALGCYTYAPLETSARVQAGEHVAVEFTDQGRVALGDRLGSGVVRLEGTLTRTDSQQLVMDVWRVAQIGGTTQRWSGENVSFSRAFVSSLQSRTLNRPKTYLAVGVAAVGFYVFARSFDLLGSYFGGNGPPPDQPPSSSRGWWF